MTPFRFAVQTTWTSLTTITRNTSPGYLHVPVLPHVTESTVGLSTRLADDVKIISESLPLTDGVYAVSWNWLYVKNGYAALRYAN